MATDATDSTDATPAREATPAGQVAGALAASNVAAAARIADARPIAVGWATVELDRAAADLAPAFGVGVERFVALPRSAWLASACRGADGIASNGVALVLIEPDTEGRLAASLARLAEGPRVTWLRASDLDAAARSLDAAGVVVSAAREGPFGPERIVVDGSAYGPYLLLVGPPTGTIPP